MMFHENKQEVCTKLAELLKATSYWHDVDHIEYKPRPEMATVYFNDREPVAVNIAMDSGKAIISDVIKRIT